MLACLISASRVAGTNKQYSGFNRCPQLRLCCIHSTTTAVSDSPTIDHFYYRSAIQLSSLAAAKPPPLAKPLRLPWVIWFRPLGPILLHRSLVTRPVPATVRNRTTSLRWLRRLATRPRDPSSALSLPLPVQHATNSQSATSLLSVRVPTLLQDPIQQSSRLRVAGLKTMRRDYFVAHVFFCIYDINKTALL